MSGRALRALVADDDDKVREMVGEFLKHEGYDVTVARDGTQALSSFDPSAFDVVVLDIQMPGMSGLDVLRQIRERDTRVPVVMMTGHGGDAEKRVAQQAGAAFLRKPFTLAALGSLLGD